MAESPKTCLDIFAAVRNRDVNHLHSILEAGVNVNGPDYQGETALFRAGLDMETCRVLLEHGANPNRGNWKNPIYEQVEFGCLYSVVELNGPVELAELLLQYGAQVDEIDEQCCGSTDPTHLDNAIENANVPMITLLLNHGVKRIGTYEDGTSLTALFDNNNGDNGSSTTTAMETFKRVCQLLIQRASSLSEIDSLVRKSFVFAIEKKKDELCEQLITSGANVHSGIDFDDTPIAFAIREGNTSFFHLLSKHKVDPFRPYHYGDEDDDLTNPLDIVIYHGKNKFDVMPLLLELWKMTYPTTGRNQVGDLPLHIICCNPLTCARMVKLLLEYDPSAIEIVDGEGGWLPFHFACMWDLNVEVVYSLIRQAPNTLWKQLPPPNDNSDVEEVGEHMDRDSKEEEEDVCLALDLSQDDGGMVDCAADTDCGDMEARSEDEMQRPLKKAKTVSTMPCV